ncbi:MAG: acyl-[acyl-carrier-protein] thioesterase [Bacteroidaceae bacterium]|nr:acyl-[acyl-carrier-protein] thioesterase [Bacteroidaceae bacterium]
MDTFTEFVEPFHVDFTGRIFLGVLGNHLLNAAGKHSSSRGWGIGALNETRHTWVLSRLSIELSEIPRQYETFTVSTWVESVMRLFTNRNFAIRRPDGTPYGFARSIWAMIDLETRKPCDLLTLYDGDILNYVVEAEDNDCPIAPFDRFRIKDATLVRTIDTHYSDVDINGHINSIKYIEHILDLFPAEPYRTGLHRFDIAYKAEAYMGDRLALYMQQEAEHSYCVEVRKEADQTVVCQAKVVFATE